MVAALFLSLSPRASYHWVHSNRNITVDAQRQQLVSHAASLFGLAKTAAPYSLCLTPKVGCSELLEYARWLSLDQHEFCKARPTRECPHPSGSRGASPLYPTRRAG